VHATAFNLDSLKRYTSYLSSNAVVSLSARSSLALWTRFGFARSYCDRSQSILLPSKDGACMRAYKIRIETTVYVDLQIWLLLGLDGVCTQVLVY
jgi:hypothetical protein